MILNAKFDLDNFSQWIEDFLPDFVRDLRKVEIPSSFSDANSIITLGESKLGVKVFIIETSKDPSGRKVGLAKDSFNLIKNYGTPNALIAYYSKSGESWRFSLLTSTPIWNEGKIITRLSNPKRHSYVLGPKAKTNTPEIFLKKRGKIIDFEDLKSRFSLEVVNKEFYKEIAECYTKLVGGTRGEGRNKKTYESLLKLPSVNDYSQTSIEFAVRLIGRIIFCWFLKEKISESGSSLMPKELLSNQAIFQNSDYYHNILENIFFQVLNKPIKSRKEQYASNEFSKIPYLNGGLFSPHEDDYFSYNEGKQAQNHNTVIVPDDWFKELFQILETYNFTIDENTSIDEELSIDPEMLGRIFENLLAEINPETGESARKSTGSYYTPRAIVDYMVDESLLLYIKQKTSIEEDKLRAIISYDLSDDALYPLNETEKKSVVDAIEKVKILDPACGSGAFPIGALQKIVFVLQQIDPDGQIWFHKQIQHTSPEIRRVIEREFSHENFDYIRKLGIIRENIYGIDIQPIATEIARLRCFLTLVVDERIDDALENRGIEPLPNLDFKFVTANTLIGLPTSNRETQIGLFEDTEGIAELREIRDMFFTASGSERELLKLQFMQAQKNMLHKLIAENRSGHAELTTLLTTWDPFSQKSSSWFDPEWMFGIKNGFDLVIANPPYVFTRKMDFSDAFKKYVKENYLSRIKSNHAKSKSKQSGKINLYGLFIIKANDLVNKEGKITYIVPNTLLRTTTYDLIRKYILDNTEIHRIVDLGDGIFDGVTASTIIIQLIKSEEPENNSVEIITKVKNISSKEYHESAVKQSAYYRNISYIFTTLQNKNIDLLLDKIDACQGKLGKYCIDIIEGIVAHKHLIASEPKDNFEPMLEGKDIGRFLLKDPRNWIDWESDEIHRRRPDYLWESEKKILIQRISGGSMPITAVLDTTKSKTFASINNLLLKSEYNESYYYILGLLNSKLINFYYANKFSNNSNLTVNISKTFLEALPIGINKTDKENLISHFAEQLSVKLINSEVENSEIEKLYTDLNSKVYELYGLNKEEVEIIEKNT